MQNDTLRVCGGWVYLGFIVIFASITMLVVSISRPEPISIILSLCVLVVGVILVGVPLFSDVHEDSITVCSIATTSRNGYTMMDTNNVIYHAYDSDIQVRLKENYTYDVLVVNGLAETLSGITIAKIVSTNFNCNNRTVC